MEYGSNKFRAIHQPANTTASDEVAVEYDGRELLDQVITSLAKEIEQAEG